MAGGAAQRRPTFEEAWPILQEEAINKLIVNIEIEGLPTNSYFSAQEYFGFYTLVYNVSANNFHEAQKLYDQYNQTFEDYISSKVLPSLRGKKNEILLRELLRRWNYHKTMSGWLSRIFQYLSRGFILAMRLPSLKEASQMIFYNLVCGEIKDQVCDAIISLVEREREGEQIDQTMVKQVLDIFEVAQDAWRNHAEDEDAVENYAEDIEEALVEATAIFYSKKALEWIDTFSYQDYMLKVVECLEKEKSRVAEYLTHTNKNKILEVAQHELLNVHAGKLEQKKLLHDMQLLKLRNVV